MNRKILMSICLLFVTNLVVAKHKVMLGRLEMVKIQPGDLEIEAKMDTGAYQTSLHAEGIEEHMFKGKRYVIFKFPKKAKGKYYEFDLPVFKDAKIKKRSADIRPGGKTYTTRPVVKMKVCLAGKQKMIEVNLTDRGHFKQKMLIGRLSMKRFSVMIDPSTEFLTVPNCK